MNSDSLITAGVTVVAAIIGVATLATILSSKSQTSSVITAAGNALANVLKTAVSPVTGGTSVSSVALPAVNDLVGSLTGGGVDHLIFN